MTDVELLDAIERSLRSGENDYVHIYTTNDEFTVERDGEWLTRPTLREALTALLKK